MKQMSSELVDREARKHSFISKETTLCCQISIQQLLFQSWQADRSALQQVSGVSQQHREVLTGEAGQRCTKNPHPQITGSAPTSCQPKITGNPLQFSVFCGVQLGRASQPRSLGTNVPQATTEQQHRCQMQEGSQATHKQSSVLSALFTLPGEGWEGPARQLAFTGNKAANTNIEGKKISCQNPASFPLYLISLI